MKIKINKFKQKFIVRIEDDGGAMLAYKGTILKINETSLEILKNIQFGHTFLETSLEMAKNYNANRKLIEDDIDCFLNQLVGIGLIEKSEYIGYLNRESL